MLKSFKADCSHIYVLIFSFKAACNQQSSCFSTIFDRFFIGDPCGL